MMRKFAIVLMVSLILIVSIQSTVKAKQISTPSLFGSHSIEEYASGFEIDVVQELKDYKEGLERDILLNTLSNKERKNLLSQISSLKEGIQLLGDNTTQLLEELTPELKAIRDVYFVVGVFNSLNYPLAAELLLQSRNNKVIDSQYWPSEKNTKQIKSTSAFNSIRNDSTYVEDSSEFNKTNSTADLYYSINKFKYTNNPGNRRVLITDRYDFLNNGNSGENPYSFLERSVVNTIYNAQRLGVIKPFKLYIAIYY